MNRVARVGLVLAALVAPLSLVSFAQAADGAFVDEVAATGDPLRLAPGFGAGRTYEVRNRSDEPAELHLRVDVIDSDDNGCVRPETRAGDVTCGSGGGELLPWLDVTVVDEDDQTLWSGSLQDLEAGAVVTDVAPAATEQIQLRTDLRRDAGNDTMTDRVSYDLAVTMTSSSGTTISSTDLRLSAGGAGGERGFFASAIRSLQEPRTYAMAMGLFALIMLPLLARPAARRGRVSERSERRSLR